MCEYGTYVIAIVMVSAPRTVCGRGERRGVGVGEGCPDISARVR